MQHETYERKLNNGSRLAVVHVPNAPVFEIETVVQSGFRLAPEGQYELPHLLEHLAFEGSKNYPDAQKFRYELERYGIYHNAWTNFYRNGFVLYGAIEYWHHITDFALEQLVNPLFGEEEIEQQKKVVENELIGKQNNPDQRPFYLMHQIHKNHQVQDYIDRLQGLKTISRDDIAKYYQALYHPANMLFLVVGDLPQERVDEIAEIIEIATADLPIKPSVDNQPLLPEAPRQTLHCIDYPYAESAVLGLSLFRPGYSADHDMAAIVMRTIIGGGMYARIFQKARKLGLTYSMSSGFSNDLDMSDFYFDDKTQSQHVVPLVELVLRELEAIARAEFTDEELERAIGFRSGIHATRFQTATSVMDWYAGHYVGALPKDDPEEFISKLQAVTRDDIMAAGEYLLHRSNPFRLLAVAGQDVDKKALQDLIDGFGV